ncbi:Uncharacterised protein [Klebsiella pneumoniae subsp. rhinoscleromatis]|nr:Uncharacterised protein [Klebsiella pneumoniae subsp. rhinoscleromatis]
MPRSRQRMADGGFTAAAWPNKKDRLCHNRRPLVPSVAKNENESTYYRCLSRNAYVKKKLHNFFTPITTVRRGAINVNLSLHLVFNQLYFPLGVIFYPPLA